MELKINDEGGLINPMKGISAWGGQKRVEITRGGHERIRSPLLPRGWGAGKNPKNIRINHNIHRTDRSTKRRGSVVMAEVAGDWR